MVTLRFVAPLDAGVIDEPAFVPEDERKRPLECLGRHGVLVVGM